MSFIFPFSDSDIPVSIAHAYRIGGQSRVIYTSVLAGFMTIVSALPFIKIPISIRATGILQSAAVPYDLIIPIQGEISRVFVNENQHVLEGDTILSMDASVATAQLRSVSARVLQLNNFMSDLNTLLGYTAQIPIDRIIPTMETSRYQAVLQQLLEALQVLQNMSRQKMREFDRYSYLNKNGVVSPAEFEKVKLGHEQSVAAYTFLVQQFRMQWHTDLIACEEELRQMRTRQTELQWKYKLHTLVSPCSGSVQNLQLLRRGSFTFTSQKIAEISPEGKLKAYCYVSASDIAEIIPGQKVSFQVDAFNYTKWGVLTGIVSEIADDLTLQGYTPVYRVTCNLDKDYFTQGNRRIFLKKGMSVVARFKAGEYSLLYLMFKGAADRISDYD
jgi:multidrug resistance efflux pump